MQGIAPVLKVTDGKALYQFHHAAEKFVHVVIVLRHAVEFFLGLFGVCDVAQEYYRVPWLTVFVHVAGEHEVSYPIVGSVVFRVTFKAYFSVKLYQLFADIVAVKQKAHGITAVLADVFVDVFPGYLVPAGDGAVFFEEFFIEFQHLKGVVLQVNVEFAEVRF
ncbi:unknown [Eubacterium sp. CAG:786]|nr:unknown [Eubacterium sp. CAG:786]